jgi:hypothetical protein
MRLSLSSNPALSAGVLRIRSCNSNVIVSHFVLNNQLFTQLLHACPKSSIGLNIASHRISHQQVSEEFCGYIWPTPSHTAIGWRPTSD